MKTVGIKSIPNPCTKSLQYSTFTLLYWTIGQNPTSLPTSPYAPGVFLWTCQPLAQGACILNMHCGGQ